ncbi:MAG TPA: tripartite tricarboxylate transporter substrate-binding protein [Burkholderiaceae bacterium]|jgi:tripartite-type tricarboxylate transporter receptor subunit TctC
MSTNRLRLLSLVLMPFLMLASLPARAQSAYPDKPVHLIVPYVPGGIFDIFGRALALRLADVWKQPVVVDNRPGAAEIIGAQMVAHAAPDGYTLFLSSETALQTNPILYAKLPYDPVKDFAPIIRIAEGTRVLVVAKNSPYHSLKDLEDAARKAPGTVSYGTSGVGTPVHILQNWFGLQTKTEYVHVPYKGTVATLPDLLGGRLQFTWAPLPLVQSFLKDGQLRPLVVTGKNRMSALPDTPTLTELGFRDMDMDLMLSLVAPAKTPPAVIAKVSGDVRAILRDKGFEQSVTLANAFTTVADTPAEFAASLVKETPLFQQRVKALNVHLD